MTNFFNYYRKKAAESVEGDRLLAVGLVAARFGNIQGDGRKFLGHFKRHLGPQISELTQTGSFLTNEANICNKGDF